MEKTLRQLITKAENWDIISGLIYQEPFSMEEFLALVDSINTIYELMHSGTGQIEYVERVADINIKANLVRCVDMERFWREVDF